MQKREKEITIRIRKDGAEKALYAYPNEYRNLMELLHDKLYLEDFGACRGVGRCGTCAVKIISENVFLEKPERNEQTTLTRTYSSQKQVRLACQILIEPGINGLCLELIEANTEEEKAIPY
jgi:2Fe-2S ferredoxin